MLEDRSHSQMDRSVRKPGDDGRLLQGRWSFLEPGEGDEGGWKEIGSRGVP